MNTFNMLLSFQITSHMNHGILWWDLSKHHLGEIESPVAGDVSWNSLRLTYINEILLAIEHEGFFIAEVVIASVAADYYLAGLDERLNFGKVECTSLNELNAGRIGDEGWKFAEVTAVATNLDGRVAEKVDCQETSELGGNSSNADCGFHDEDVFVDLWRYDDVKVSICFW